MSRVLTVALVLALAGLARPVMGGEPQARLAYARVTDGFWQIWTYNPATRAHRQLTTTPFDKRDPVSAPGGRLAFRSHNDELYEIAFSGRAERPLAQESWPAFDPIWSPDGEWLAFARVRTNANDVSAIWVVSAAGENRRVLARGPDLQTHPTWSPDGRFLAYVRSFGSMGSELRQVTVDSGEDEVVFGDGFHTTHPAWSPDGRQLLFASERSGDYEIYARNLKSGLDTRLTHAAGLDSRPCWSPDGRSIVFTSFRRQKLEIWAMKADGSGQAPLFEVDTEASDPAWY